MKIYKYWQKATKEFSFIPQKMGYYVEQDYQPKSKKIRVVIENGKKKYFQSVTCYGGSNFSEEMAIQKAKEKLDKIEQIRNGENTSEYEVDIKEELIYKINDENIITRNRYGALVLNSTELMFIDVDQPKTNIFNDFKIFFGISHKKSPKETMLQDISREIKKEKYHHLTFRVYETFKGFRVLVTGIHFNPKSKESRKMMQDFNADYLYRFLCEKQACYRARLTPKPNRIKLKNLSSKFPKTDEKELNRLKDWVTTYDEKSKNYATCKLIFSKKYSIKHPVVELHDKICNVNTNLNLA